MIFKKRVYVILLIAGIFCLTACRNGNEYHDPTSSDPVTSENPKADEIEYEGELQEISDISENMDVSLQTIKNKKYSNMNLSNLTVSFPDIKE